MHDSELSSSSGVRALNKGLQQKLQQSSQASSLLTLRSALRTLDRTTTLGKQSTFTVLLELCSRLKVLREAKRLHFHISRRGLDRNTFLANFIISTYGHCGSVSDARLMFDNMPQRNVVSWNAMIAVYGDHGDGKRALRLLKHMHQDGLQPKRSTFITALSACTTPDLLKPLVSLHESIQKQGLENDLVVGNALINAYGKCGSAKAARKVFHKMQDRDIISWNSMISALARNGYLKKAFELFERMHVQHVQPDKVTFVNLLSGCTSIADLDIGRKIYGLVLKIGYQYNMFIGSALITMFGKCGCVDEARLSFDMIRYPTVVPWNAMIVAYKQCGCHQEALQHYKRMLKEGVKPNKITFTTVLEACATPQDLEEGRSIHFHAKKCKLDRDVFVRSALISMYGKCGSLEEAQHVFRIIEPPDLVSSTAMIGACAQLGRGDEAFDVFCQMVKGGIKPNQVTYINILSACASLTAAVEGKAIHCSLIEGEFDAVVEVANALVNMYSKCGYVEDARKVFNKMHAWTIVSWTSMLEAYAANGYGKEALDIFRRMQQDGVKPDAVTYVSVLTACSHAGLIREAREHFFSMSVNYGIKPNSSHYACMIDMFARIGRLDEAENFIKKAPFNVGPVEWMALLGACRNNGDVERAECAAEQVLVLDPLCRAAYLVLSNIYGTAGRWNDVERLERRMEQHGIKEQLGCRSICNGQEMQAFTITDPFHLQTRQFG